MRTIVAITLALACLVSQARADDRFKGFLTLGCGDSYLKAQTLPETWSVKLSSSQTQALFATAKIDPKATKVWLTLYVEVEGRLDDGKRTHGYFFDHPKELIVQRFIAVRYPEPGETVQASTEPARMHRGYMILGPESRGFVDANRKDEYWWIIPGIPAQQKIDAYYRDKHILDKPRLEALFIEFVGRVGPPGGYGHMGDFNREVEVEDFKIVRRDLKPDELRQTAAMDGVIADIDKCAPQHQ